MTGSRPREPIGSTNGIHYAKVDYTNVGSTVNIGDIPPSTIININIAKTVDFDGTAPIISIGINYSDGTTDDTDALVAGADLSSTTALGPIEATKVDSAAWKVDVNATLTATLGGTSVTAGEAFIVVEYVSDRDLVDLT